MTEEKRKSENLTNNMTVYANVRRQGRFVLLSICDADLLGKTLREGRIVFEIRENFYKGSKMSVEEAITLAAQSTVVNLVGHRTVTKAVEQKLVHPEAILKISGIPHAQIIKT